MQLERSALASWYLWLETDESSVLAWSARLASGRWLDVPAYRPWFSWQAEFGPPEAWARADGTNAFYQGPLYPYTLALLRVADVPPVVAMRLLQLLLASLAAGAVAAACDAVLSRAGATGAARAAGALAAGLFHGLFGPLVFLDGFLYRDGPFAHAVALLLAAPLLVERPRSRSGFLLGLGAGAAALLKQTSLPLGLAALWAVSRRPESGRERYRLLGAGVAGLLLALAPLALRNAAAGTPLLTFDTRLRVGLAWATAWGTDGTPLPSPHLLRILERDGGSTLTTARLVLETYREDPLALVALELKKLGSFVAGLEVADNASVTYFRERLPLLGVLPVWACLLGPGVAGLVLAGRRRFFRRGEGMLVAAALGITVVSCLLVSTTTRYRAAAAGPLAIGAGLLVAAVAADGRAGGWRRGVPAVGGAVALSLATLLPSPIPVGRHRWVDAVVHATLLESEGDADAAAAEIGRYLRDGGDDVLRADGLLASRAWLSGDRTLVWMAPGGVAPPGRRFVSGSAPVVGR